MEIKKILLLGLTAMLLCACDRSWDLSDAYDNSESSKPKEPQPGPEEPDDTEEHYKDWISGELSGGIAYKLGPRKDIVQPVTMPMRG